MTCHNYFCWMCYISTLKLWSWICWLEFHWRGMRLYCSKGRGWSEWRPDGKNYVIKLSLISQISHSRPLPIPHTRYVHSTYLYHRNETTVSHTRGCRSKGFRNSFAILITSGVDVGSLSGGVASITLLCGSREGTSRLTTACLRRPLCDPMCTVQNSAFMRAHVFWVIW
jgi:hypothetical protein